MILCIINQSKEADDMPRTETSASEKNYYNNVRKTLRSRLDEAKAHGLLGSNTAMVKVINQYYFQRSKTFAGEEPMTLDKWNHLFDEGAVIPLPVIVALADILHIDLADLIGADQFAYDKAANAATFYPYDLGTAKELNWLPMSLEKQNGLAEISKKDRYYLGDYYIYYFRPKQFTRKTRGRESEPSYSQILCGKLNLKIQGEKTVATLEEQVDRKTFLENEPMPSIVMQGRAYRLTDSEQVYMMLNDAKGQSQMALMMPYYTMRRDVVYFNMGGILRPSAELHQVPLLQKAAIFRRPIDLEKYGAMLRGLLAMTGESLFLQKENFARSRVKAQLPEEQWQKILHAEGEYFVVHLNELLDAADLRYETKMSVMLQLQGLSEANAVQAVRVDDEFPAFTKRMQKDDLETEKINP